VLDEFRFDPEEGPIIVPVTIKGKSYPFMLDTGCSISLFDESLRPLLGPTLGEASGKTPDGPTPIIIVGAPAAYVGRQPFPQGGFVAVHGVFRKVREDHGVKVWGALGMDFLARHVVRIDFDRGRVALLRSAEATAGHQLRVRRIQ
jgi:hypothetical protein